MDRIQWVFYQLNKTTISVFSPDNGSKFLVYDRANNILKAAPGDSEFPWTVSQASPGSDLLL